jgi:electron transfer flavoprotein beta subunit
MSPYDEYAVEEALKIREAKGGTVTVFSVGPQEAQVVLKKALAMGADEAVLIQDDTPEDFDGLRTSRIIAAAVQQKYTEYDLILFGKQSMGADNAQVPAMVAEMLGIPQVCVITELALEANTGNALREIEGASERVSVPLPAVFSAQKGLNEPRYETLKGIMMAKRKEIPVLTPAELGLSDEQLAPQVTIVRMDTPPAREAGKIVEGDAAETAQQLVDFLHYEAKVV